MADEWRELKISVSVSQRETAEAIASMLSWGGIYTEDYSDLENEVEEIAHIDLIDEELIRSDRESCVIHLYVSPQGNPAETADELKTMLGNANVAFTLDESSLFEEDWANGWRKYYKQSKVGEKLYICPEWQTPADAQGRTVIKLDPGAAFGTGSHETTRLCLTLLENYANENVRLLDVGCGSGILAIGCALLGVKDAVAVDIDPVAVKVARENAELNGVSDKIEFICGDLNEKVSGKFDLVAANIVADVIKRLLLTLPDMMNDGATAVFSGIIDTREDEMVAAVKNAGLSVVSVLRDRGWIAICAAKPHI